jgi:cytosine/adenosine deaminase-related metal-dependent hydrolase
MARLLVTNARVLVPVALDPSRDLVDGALVAEDHRIVWTGPSTEAGDFGPFDSVLDASGCVVLPGLVNTHHHLYQTLTRNLATADGLGLFDWLTTLYPIWAGLTPEAAEVSARLGLAELALSGATTVADHLYLFPNGTRLDDTIVAARAAGMRFHPTRGSMSLGQSQGGLPPDSVCEPEASILADCERLIAAFHDPDRYSMLRLGLAPCSPFSVTPALMRATAELARRHPKVGLHTHLAETRDEEAFCLRTFGLRPADYVASLGWEGADVWFAHLVHPSPGDVAWLARTGTGCAHCPSSNMILSSGIAPIRSMLDAGVNVGLGVDGSASNDANDLAGESRQALLLQRVAGSSMTAREALHLATAGGAAVLGRDDLGTLEAGQAADLVAFRVDGPGFAGARGDIVSALVTCGFPGAWFTVVHGRVIVDRQVFLPYDLAAVARRHETLSRALVGGRAPDERL